MGLAEPPPAKTNHSKSLWADRESWGGEAVLGLLGNSLEPGSSVQRWIGGDSTTVSEFRGPQPGSARLWGHRFIRGGVAF